MTRPSAARVLLLLSFAQSWLITILMTSGMSTLPHRAGLARVLPVDILLSSAPWAVYSLIYAAAMFAFLIRRREDLAGGILLVLLALQVALEMSVRRIFMPHLEAMLAGGLMASWLLGRWWARRQGSTATQQDHVAHEAVAGTFGAMMVLAAGSKLHLSGVQWFSGAAHCATMMEHELLSPGLPGTRLRQFLIGHVWMCSAGAVFALVVEALGWVMIWPRLRRLYAIAVCILFLSLAVFYGIMEVSWPLMATALAWSHMGDPGRSRDTGIP